MPRAKAISNRQRKLQQKTTPARPYAVVLQERVSTPVKPEPRGEALRQATLAEVRQRVGHDEAELDRAGYIRVRNRDGLASLVKSGGLTDAQGKAGLAYRLAYEAQGKGLGSCLANAGNVGGSRKMVTLTRSAAELHRAALLAHLNRMERAVAEVMEDGRELHALRLIAGEGQTVERVGGGSGHAKEAVKAALRRALDAIAVTLRITGD